MRCRAVPKVEGSLIWDRDFRIVISVTWGWMRHVRADAWSAAASWAAVTVAVITVLVAGFFAHKQVNEAKKQVREAQSARLQQERQAREALASQAKIAQDALNHQAAQAQETREKQAQPNVTAYMEHSLASWHLIELVIKNFGATPAYNVEVSFDPPPQVSAEIKGQRNTNLPYPELIPFLAPQQEWRTFWDSGIERTAAENIASHHDVEVKFEDDRGKPFVTKAILDWEILVGKFHVENKGINDFVKVFDRKLKEQNQVLEEIRKVLVRYSEEHEGIWVYHSQDDDERQFRAERAQQEAEEYERRRLRLERMRHRLVPQEFEASNGPADAEATPLSADETEPHSPADPGEAPSEPNSELDSPDQSEPPESPAGEE